MIIIIINIIIVFYKNQQNLYRILIMYVWFSL